MPQKKIGSKFVRFKLKNIWHLICTNSGLQQPFKEESMKYFMSLALVFLCAAANADLSNRKTYVHFDGALIVPGAQLESDLGFLAEAGGDYVFKLADTPGRNVVMILNADETEVLAMMNVIQTQRSRLTEDTEIVYYTRADGKIVLQKWFYPGEYAGYEFLGWRDHMDEPAQVTPDQDHCEDHADQADQADQSAQAN